jgi:S-adenosylmethionine:tRNA ribosyltransferase-isomerase
MKTSDFSFDLPENLIAQFPPEERGTSRLMVLDRQTRGRSHASVAGLADFLDKGSLLVFNNSRVRKARLLGASLQTGAGAEFLLLKRLGADTWQALAQRAKRRRAGSRYVFGGAGDEAEAEIVDPERLQNAARCGNGCCCAEAASGGTGSGEYRILRFDRPIDDDWLDKHGHIPLPPYIKRGDTPADGDRYQTVYARTTGSAAAPTAGLHFTNEILSNLEQNGIETAFITLHVGLGTFLPVRAENIEDHTMHEEVYSIDEKTASAVEKAKREGRKVIAVGTTSVRTLESAWKDGHLARGENSTSIFIYPGYRFKAADGLFTNFHTPRSSLLMLVSAFAGRDFILESYQEAVRERYRFFSYGDAMLIQ